MFFRKVILILYVNIKTDLYSNLSSRVYSILDFYKFCIIFSYTKFKCEILMLNKKASNCMRNLGDKISVWRIWIEYAVFYKSMPSVLVIVQIYI